MLFIWLNDFTGRALNKIKDLFRGMSRDLSLSEYNESSPST